MANIRFLKKVEVGKGGRREKEEGQMEMGMKVARNTHTSAAAKFPKQATFYFDSRSNRGSSPLSECVTGKGQVHSS